MLHDNAFEEQPVVSRVEDFDIHSGSMLERLLFNNRLIVVAVCLAVTALMWFQAGRLRSNASFERMIPTAHPYIANFIKYKEELPGLGNSIRIAVETRQGTIFDARYLNILRNINDEVFLLPGVDRSAMKSLWTPATRWTRVTEDGFAGGPVIPDTYDGSPRSVGEVRTNVERSGETGQLVAGNYRSSIIYVPLLEVNTQTGEPLDYGALSSKLDQIREKYQGRYKTIRLHITGFAKIAGDMIQGEKQVLVFFAIAALIAAAMLFWFTRCLRSTLLVIVCSLIAVVWQLGLIKTLGFELDPYAILVPFLVFSIGMSHGAQKMNGIMQDIGRGTHRVVAARYTFRRLFMAGLSALLCDAVGFAVLMVIRISAIQELAVMASIGVAVLIFTNLALLPILLSYTGVSLKAAERSLKSEMAYLSGENKHYLWRFLDLFTHRKMASLVIALSAVLGLAGFLVASHLQIGDLDPGAPELRQGSRYNKDNSFMTANYASSSDVLVVMVKTPPEMSMRYGTLMKADALEWQLRQLQGVESAVSMASFAKQAIVGLNEGNLKWYDLVHNQDVLSSTTMLAPRDLFNVTGDIIPIFVFLKDHKADTLTSVVEEVEAFADRNNTSQARFLLAAGNSGIEAATNIVVKHSMHTMLLWVYGAVILLSFIVFRSWRAVAVALIPLAVTSILCEALMVWLRIGVKVATLPVVALGVGIGVDYALYILTVVVRRMRDGMPLSAAYYRALLFTGRVVILTGFTLAVGVATWIFSPIKFQSDMGILLSFMFLWNMLGALIVLPALGRFLLPRPVCGPAETDLRPVALTGSIKAESQGSV
jgi:predicted RND superfamily exporter protein